MIERIVDDYASTLAGAWASGANPAAGAAFGVASTNDAFGQPLPATGFFPIRVENEVALVTREGAGAGQLVVVQRAVIGAAAGHPDGAAIESPVTGGVLRRLMFAAMGPPAYVAGDYYGPPSSAPRSSGSPGGAVVNRIYLHPLVVSRRQRFDAIAFRNQAIAATGVVRLGLYRSTDPDGYPGALAIEAGTVTTDTVGDKVATFAAITLDPGLYWAALKAEVLAWSALTAMRGEFRDTFFAPHNASLNTAQGCYVKDAGAAGALPDPAGVTDADASSAQPPMAYLRAA